MHLRLLLPAFALIAASLFAADTPTRRPVIWNNAASFKHTLVSHHTWGSEAIGETVGFTVYLPPGYGDSPERRYPVIYFLHGAGGNENADGPGFAGIVDRLIKAGRVPEAICVFPNGGMSGYRNNPRTGINAETMIIDELVPLVDRQWRTLANRNARVIAGYSMGGGGAVHLALKHPQVFSAAASLAGAMTSRDTGELPVDLTAEALRGHDPVVRLFIVAGFDDTATYASHAPLLRRLDEAHYTYTYRPLRDQPHHLGKYYQRAGEDLVEFLLVPMAGLTAPGVPDPSR